MNYNKLHIGVLGLLAVGFAATSAGLFHLMDEVAELEAEIDRIESQEQVIYVNDTDRGLESIFRQTGDSVVYVEEGQSQGSGFVYDEQGHIVTNQHVVEESDTVEVTFTDGETRSAEVIGEDPYTDLAVLDSGREGPEPLEMGDSSDVNVGEMAVAIGNPFGLESSLTQGVISQTGRSITVEGGFSIRNVIQTDASINPGNSGGPLLNREGEVIGVNTAIETDTGTFSGVGFAVPSNTVERVVPAIIEREEYNHPWIGVQGLDVNQDIAEEMDLDNARGFLVLEVVEGSPADEAGLQPSTDEVEIDGEPRLVGGDVIIEADGEEVRGIEDLLEHLAEEKEVGQEMEVTMIRDGEEVTETLVLQERP